MELLQQIQGEWNLSDVIPSSPSAKIQTQYEQIIIQNTLLTIISNGKILYQGIIEEITEIPEEDIQIASVVKNLSIKLIPRNTATRSHIFSCRCWNHNPSDFTHDRGPFLLRSATPTRPYYIYTVRTPKNNKIITVQVDWSVFISPQIKQV